MAKKKVVKKKRQRTYIMGSAAMDKALERYLSRGPSRPRIDMEGLCEVMLTDNFSREEKMALNTAIKEGRIIFDRG